MSVEKEMKIKKRFFYEGVELALFLAESKGLCEYVEIAEFYGGLIQNAFAWFCESKYPEIIEEYKACDDPHKNFGRAVKYGYFMRVFVSDESESTLTVSCDACLENAKGESVYEFCDEHRWDKELSIMVKKKKGKRIRA